MKRKLAETAEAEDKIFRARSAGPALQFEFPGFTTGMGQTISSQDCSMQDCLADLDELVGCDCADQRKLLRQICQQAHVAQSYSFFISVARLLA